MIRHGTIAVMAAGALTALVAGCVSAPEAPPPVVVAATSDLPATEWRRIIQTEKRFSVYISAPAVREGDLAHFRLVYVYMPGEIIHEGREVASQEYAHVTLDCTAERVRLGTRTRYAPDGTAFGQDGDQNYAPIMGMAVFRAQEVHCKDKPWAGMNVIPGGADWIARARAAIATSAAL
ncbi:MAG: hypothetical protein ACK46Q_06285 [Hyphomonas sp.]